MKLQICLLFLISCMAFFALGAYTVACFCGLAIHQPILSSFIGVIGLGCFMSASWMVKKL